MDKDNNKEMYESSADKETEPVAVGESVKKIVVPVALTVGLLGNSHQVAGEIASRTTIPDSDNIIISETVADMSAPVVLDGEYDDSEEDDEKRSYKGSSLIKAGAYSSLVTVTGVAESSLGSIASELLVVVLGVLLRFAGVFGIISGLFLGTFKAVYPDRKISEIISVKNVSRTALATVAVMTAFYVLDSVSSQRNVFIELIKNSFILVVLLVLWFRVFELKGKFGNVMRNLFWGKKGKILLALLIGVNVFMSFAHIVYNTYYTSNTFVRLVVFYVVSACVMAVIYNLSKGRMIEDDDLEMLKKLPQNKNTQAVSGQAEENVN